MSLTVLPVNHVVFMHKMIHSECETLNTMQYNNRKC